MERCHEPAERPTLDVPEKALVPVSVEGRRRDGPTEENVLDVILAAGKERPAEIVVIAPHRFADAAAGKNFLQIEGAGEPGGDRAPDDLFREPLRLIDNDLFLEAGKEARLQQRCRGGGLQDPATA